MHKTSESKETKDAKSRKKDEKIERRHGQFESEGGRPP